MISLLEEVPESIILIYTNRSNSYSLESFSWCHIDGSDEIWDSPLDEDEIIEELFELIIKYSIYQNPPDENLEDDNYTD